MSQSPNGPNSIQIRLRQPAQPPPRFRPAFLLILFGFVVPFTALQVPREIGRWHFASALRYRAKKQPDAAYEQLDRAIYWLSDNPATLLQKAEWKSKDGKHDEAIALANVAVEQDKTNIGSKMMRGDLLFNASKFSDAIEDFKEVKQRSRRIGRPPLYEVLNQLAYTRAVNNSGLDEALADINEALGLLPETADTPGSVDNRTKGLFLDTRGYIFYRKGEYEPAVNDLTEAIIRVEARIVPKSAQDAKGWVPPILRGLTGDESNAQQQRAIAVIYYHRSLALQASGQDRAAAKDRAMVKVLIGREPDEALF